MDDKGQHHETTGIAGAGLGLAGSGLGAAALAMAFLHSRPACNYTDRQSGILDTVFGMNDVHDTCEKAQNSRTLNLPPISSRETLDSGYVNLDGVIHEIAMRMKDISWQPTCNDRISVHDATNNLFIVRHVSFQGLDSYYFIESDNAEKAVNEVLRKM